MLAHLLLTLSLLTQPQPPALSSAFENLPQPSPSTNDATTLTSLKKNQPHTFPSPTRQAPAFVLRNLRNTTLDLTGVTLVGNPIPGTPDTFTGVAILIEDCENLTLTGLTARGYQIAVLARNSPGLTITRCDFSNNYAPRLFSTPLTEDNRDWLSFHHNDDNQWLALGAAIYLDSCPYPTITWNRASGGKNGLLLSRTDNALVHSNTFHYLSGVGIGLYRSSFNAVMHNRLDYCVRGYSHGVYSRGQDSAALLVYEQSSNNLFAYNSATHSGDGFFLWAGQTTMDTGQGGCNDNLVYGNDFSHAPANGIQATFSRNYFLSNQIDDCDHGIWAGYSFDSLILANTLSANRVGIAIEHGQSNTILANHLASNTTAIRLWARPTQPPDWPYPTLRDTASRHHLLSGNTFAGNADLVLQRTTEVSLHGTVNLRHDAHSTFTRLPDPAPVPDLASWTPPQIPGAQNPFLPRTATRGRHTILITPFGPYDHRSPLIRIQRQTPDSLLLDVLGPPSRWNLTSLTGATSTTTSGKIPGTLELKLPKAISQIQLAITASGTPLTFSHLHLPLDFAVRFFSFSETADLTDGELPFLSAIAAQPLARDRRSSLNFSSVPPLPGLPSSHYITIAESALPFPPGQYLLKITADDGVRVYLDHDRIIDEWRQQTPKTYAKTLTLTGFQSLRIEHFQLTGDAKLQLTLIPSP